MKDKKADILTAAKKLFAQKGYSNVSMQAIAEECKVSKASIYKLFQSKEDLLLALIKYNQQEMLKRGAMLNAESALTPKEKFARKIALEITEFRENRQFINFISNDTSPHTAVFKEHLKQTRSMIICWHRDSILQAYGEDVKPFIWDLVIIFHGLMREFLFLSIIKNTQPDIETIPSFIMMVMDLVVEKKKAGDPSTSLNEDIIASFRNSTSCRMPNKEELLSGHLQKLKEAIGSLSKEEYDVDELQSAAELLKEELFTKEQRTFLIQALLDYLGQIERLQHSISQIKTICITE
ncbi:TetR/AcrR family transcriptional regulator [Bacillus glycinifermentans]|uniref:TetR/AcrR family transcriptional regulator n=1 Tax=Bacillus glycinifermentans TaxID=1664069 RepID=UPI001FF334AB|nr:TetR/AcrR family transcriptional regulator [Bacillus glycinifermentans]MEC0494446.1 helix-turn-helix domain containing protein [Bacillus glycinifermentans]MEC0539800.1 helix-turn-helix domain containing protein [Bacillus glycinifermentans]UOY87874.1 TetR/AcrR family transcriptional regulator [Bacillus glycinifermentans]